VAGTGLAGVAGPQALSIAPPAVAAIITSQRRLVSEM
jgi:hypothetical protein